MVKSLDLNTLLMLVQHRWNICILAEIHAHHGSKFVTMVNRIGLSRSSLKTSLAHLKQQELVKRNPGYGHPMRPEYVLTNRGRAIGQDCQVLSQLLSKPSDRDVAYRKWSLPLIAVIGEERMRFSAVRVALGDPTPRAVTLALKMLENQRWIQRKITRDYPPVAGYKLSSRGLEIWYVVRELCQH